MRPTPARTALLAALLACASARAAERSVDPAPQLSVPAPSAPTLPQIPQLPTLPQLAPGAALPGALPQAGVPSAAIPQAAGPQIAAQPGSLAPAGARAPVRRSADSPRGENVDKSSGHGASLAANEQLRGLSQGAGEIRGAIGEEQGASGAEAGKRLSDEAFDRAAKLSGQGDAAPAGAGDGSGRGGPPFSRGDPKAVLALLGVPKSAADALYAAAPAWSRASASVAAAAVYERSDTLSKQQAAALIAAALLRGAPMDARTAVLAQLRRAEPEAAALAGALLDGRAPGEAGSAAARWLAAWSPRLAYWEEVSASLRSPERLSALSRDASFGWLPSALREQIADSVAFHERPVVPVPVTPGAAPTRNTAAFSLSRGARVMLAEAVAKGQLTPEQAEDWSRLIYRDPLTGLRNRVDLDDNLEPLLARTRSLISFKLDFLKEINDELDHEAGNRALKAVAAVASQALGGDSLLFRRSPTGFVVLVDAAPEQAAALAQALRAVVKAKVGDPVVLLGEAAAGRTLAGTVSMGVSPLESASRALAEQAVADAARYDRALSKAQLAREFAKNLEGGDRVALASAVDGRDSTVMPREELEAAVAALARSRPREARTVREAAARPVEALVEAQQAQARAPKAEALLAGVREPSLREALFSAVYRDRLSGLRNRRWLFDHLAQLMGPGGMTHYIALDIDKFGEKNELLGEEKADLVLAELGALLDEKTRGRDATALHLSGEEFVLLTGAGEPDAGALAEEVRAAVQKELGARAARERGVADPRTGQALEVTVSLGVAPIKQQAAGPEPALTLATAMAEALLQRAKAAGRNRVAVQPVSPADAVLATMRRLMRVTEAVRAAVAGALGASEPPAPEKPPLEPSAPFPQGFTTRAMVVAGLGYDPARERGSLLSAAEKASSYVARLTPPGRPGVVVKIAPEETVVNEMAMRGVLEAFEELGAGLRAPRTGAYRRWFLNPVMVMEDIRPQGTRMGAGDLPLGQKAALALFALTFGVHDLNPGAFLRVGWQRTVIADFERARTETRAASSNRLGTFSETLWVSTSYLNDEADYRPALERWRADFARPESQERLAAILRSAGVPEKRIPRDLELFRGNLERLPQVLAADITLANRWFRETCARAGLNARQARALSDLNRAAHRSPADGIPRDVLRALLGREPMKGQFSVDPEEIAALARRKQAFSASARERLLQAAGNGGLFSFDGRPIEPARAAAAFDALKRLFGS